MIRTVLFDLDGTIIDSEPLAIQAIVDCSAQWGLSISRDDAAFVAGKKWELAFDHLFRAYNFPLPREEAAARIMGRYQEILQGSLRVVPGVVEAIQDFSAHFQLAMVSGSNRDDVHWALRQLGVHGHFRCILGAEDYPLSKPAPDGFLKAIQLLGADPRETLAFEDSAAGIASALAAGVRVTAIESTNHFKHDQSGAQARIPDFSGVRADWVRKNFP
jgi:HAD superfamily hydrolase (TIGR01509 family)